MPDGEDEPPPGNCAKCKDEVRDPATCRTSQAVKCDLCKEWYHKKCAEIEDLIYKAINSSQGQMSLYWMCKSCFESGRLVLDKMAEIVNKLNEQEERVKALEDKQNESKEVVETYAANAAKQYLNENPGVDLEKQKEQIVRTLKEEVKSGEWPELREAADGIALQNRFQVLEEKLEEKNEEKKKQSLDEEKRKNNIVVYGVKEEVDTDKDKRLRHDKDEIIRLSHFLGLEEFSDYNIAKIIRMGPYEKDTNRPLLVELDSAVTKYKIMRNTFKLGDATGKADFAGWSVQHDMTQEQRKHVRELVAEAKKKEREDTSGEYIYRVRGPPHDKYIKKIKRN